VPDVSNRSWTFVEGGVVRGDTSRRTLAVVFTGGDFGEGADQILDVLARQNVKASFFVTGDFVRTREFHPALRRMVTDGHYLGPHSDTHPLYCPWDDRSKTLVTEAFFKSDVQKNIDDLRALGALTDRRQVVYFIPPFEWYNQDQTRWAAEMGVLLFNFTPGSGSNRDWAPEGHKSFVASKQIIDDILAYERTDPYGLNGFLLLLHVGSQRQDKPWKLLESLVAELKSRGYEFARVDRLLSL
jgi:peptidoglycan/xylan/chitin deacetylase (PgdA/CDA1 family)